MPEINTFKDWWRANSEEIFQRTKKTDNWWEEFEKCWDIARALELKRCATLSAHRLSLEASREFFKQYNKQLTMGNFENF